MWEEAESEDAVPTPRVFPFRTRVPVRAGTGGIDAGTAPIMDVLFPSVAIN